MPHVVQVFNSYSSGGFITKEDIGKILNENDEEKIRKIVIEMDHDNDGKVDFNDFLGFMTSDDPEAQKKLGLHIESPQVDLKKKLSVGVKGLSVNTRAASDGANPFYGASPLSPMPRTPNWQAIKESEAELRKSESKSGSTPTREKSTGSKEFEVKAARV
jgi:hypothetical protein